MLKKRHRRLIHRFIGTPSLQQFITKTWPRLILAVVLMGGASPQTINLVPSATVIARCTITQAVPLAFGAYDPVVTNRIANLNIAPNALSVSCTRGAPSVYITLDLGTHFVGALRYMSDGAAHTLHYEVYTSADRTTIWNMTNSVTYTSVSMAAKTLPVYGTVPGGQDATYAVLYTDTLTATINF